MSAKTRSNLAQGAKTWRAAAVVALALGTSLVAACAAPSPAPSSDAGDTETIRMAQSWVKNVSNASVWMGIDGDHMSDEGIDLEVLPGGPNAPSAVVQVTSGSAEIGQIDDLSILLQAISEGNDLVIIGAGLQKTPAGLLSLSEDPVTSPEALATAKVLGAPNIDAWVRGALTINDQSLDEYQLVPTGPTPDGLLAHDGNAYSAFRTSAALILETQHDMQEGEEWEFVSWEDLGMPTYNQVYFAERSWLDEHAEQAEGFLRALMKGHEDWKNDPEAAAKKVVEVYAADGGLQLEQQIKESELTLPFSESDLTEEHGLFWLDTDRLTGSIYDGFKAAGFATPDSVDEFVDMQYQIAAREGL